MISVIIATHNRADLLDEELRQIYKQKNVEFEVFVINDNEEPEETDGVMAKYPLATYIKNNKIQGPCNKFKAGFKLSKGQYLYMPNDDDYLTDDYFFAKSEAILNNDKTISFVSGNVTILYDYIERTRELVPNVLNIEGRIPAVDYMQHFQEDYEKPLSTCSTIFRKKAFDRIGIDNIIEFTDASQYLMALLYGDAYIMKDDVAIYRIRETKNSLTYNASKDFIINVLKQKETIYRWAKTVLPQPRKFWANQFRITYTVVTASNMNAFNQIMINLWGVLHSHWSRALIKYALKNIYKVTIKHREK